MRRGIIKINMATIYLSCFQGLPTFTDEPARYRLRSHHPWCQLNIILLTWVLSMNNWSFHMSANTLTSIPADFKHTHCLTTSYHLDHQYVISSTLVHKYLSSSELLMSMNLRSHMSNSCCMFRTRVHCKSWPLKAELPSYKVRVKWLHLFISCI